MPHRVRDRYVVTSKTSTNIVALAEAIAMQIFGYILANTKRGVMYVGITTNIGRRLVEHRSGIVPGFASRHGALLLVHLEAYESMIDARAREHALKRWRRAWKFALIEECNPEWRDLSADL